MKNSYVTLAMTDYVFQVQDKKKKIRKQKEIEAEERKLRYGDDDDDEEAGGGDIFEAEHDADLLF